jgi:hypothetical protein
MSLCNLPTFSFAFTLPGFSFTLPSLPTFSLSFTLPCPLD